MLFAKEHDKTESLFGSRNGNLPLSVHFSVTLGLFFHTVKIVYPMKGMSEQVPGEETTLVLCVSPHRSALDLRLWIKVLASALYEFLF